MRMHDKRSLLSRCVIIGLREQKRIRQRRIYRLLARGINVFKVLIISILLPFYRHPRHC